jgi:predicted TIM-barrel fold metal-dependent hydrolase
MIIDTHIHVWKSHSDSYPWQPLANVAPDYDWPVEKEIEVMDQYGLDKGVLIQPSMYSFDNRYMLDCSRRFPDRFRLVGLVNPLADAVESDIEALATEGVAGLRLAAMLRPDLPWYNDSRADRVWTKATELNMVVTLLVAPQQVAPVGEVIGRFPETNVVIDHLARPDKITTSAEQVWFQHLLALAQFKQVYVKLSALAFMSREPYPHQDILALVRQVFDAFGPERLMWGSDTPISQNPATLPETLRLIDLALPEASPEDRAAIMGRTAARLFGWTQ